MVTGGDPPIEAAEFDRRMALLSDLHVLASLPIESLAPLVPGLREETYAAGRVIVSDAAAASRRFVIVSGVAEVAAQGPAGPTPLATLGPGELFGEATPLDSDGDRHAVITAQSDVQVVSVDGVVFERLVADDPWAGAAFAWTAEHRMTARFLRLATPFAALTPAQARALSLAIRREHVPAGAIVLRQGVEGDTAYLVMKGRLEVVLETKEGIEQPLATLRPGMLFGEAALLNRGPRNATVRAVEPCELLVLGRDDILGAMGAERDVRTRMLELLQLRALPRRLDRIQVHERPTPDGQSIRTLKDPLHGRYYRLSPQGWFLWQRLDGQHTLRQLTLDYFYEYQSFSPQVIAQVLGGLAASGFIVAPALASDVLEHGFQVPWWQRTLIRIRRIATWQRAIQGLDPMLTRAYRRGVWVFYTRAAQTAAALLIVAGIAAFAAGAATMSRAILQFGPALLLFLVPANLVAVFSHELGHAFAVKAFGREVPRAGVGWYWFGPIAFVDTSDMWLADRWPRIAVNLAGIHANLILAAIAAFMSRASSDLFWSAVWWQWALSGYWMVVMNLNPLLEYDGYYVLSDWLDIPNLRPRAMAWLGHDLARALRTRGGLRGHTLDLLYGLASALYIVLMGVTTIVVYRFTIAGWVARVAPGWLAGSLAWMAALLVTASAAAALVSELRAPRPAADAAL